MIKLSDVEDQELKRALEDMFDLDDDMVIIKWDGLEPIVVLERPENGYQEEMVQSEYIFGSSTDDAFELLWYHFSDKEPVKYVRD